jgi:hypothetical protein
LYALLRDTAKARDVLEELLRQQPGNKTAQEALEVLH